MRQIWNNKMDQTPGKYEKTGPKPPSKRAISDKKIKASLPPAQQADFDADCKDANLEIWLAEQGRTEESNRVYTRRMERAARRGDFGPGQDIVTAFEVVKAEKNSAAHAAFKAAWDQDLARERSAEAVREAFGPTRTVAEVPAEEVVTPTQVDDKVFDGTYTLISGKDGSHRTLRIRRQKADASFKPSVSLVGLLIGRDNENDYLNFGHVQDDGSLQVWSKHRDTDNAKIGTVLFALLKMDALGQKFAAAGYRVEVSKRCYRCHRVLTHPQSLASGIGPECASK